MLAGARFINQADSTLDTHRPSAFRGAALLTASITLGTALGVSQLYALVLFGPIAAGWHAAPVYGGTMEGVGAATFGAIASFVCLLVLFAIGIGGSLTFRAGWTAIIGVYGIGYVLFGLPFVLVVGGVLGRVGFHAKRVTPRRFRASSS